MDRRSFLKWTAAGALACGMAPVLQPAWALAQAAADTPPAPVRYKVADGHFHYLDFIQKTEGMQALIASMDAAGVEHIMFSGMPLIKKWDAAAPLEPTYYLDDNGRTYWYTATDFIIARRYQELSATDKKRFHPFICGINATDKHAILHVRRMLDEYPDVWQGIGEIFGHRDDLTNLTYGETARGNHPALAAIYDLAAERNLPVCLHNNATSRNRLDKPIYAYEVREALSNHPKTKFIWAHAGLSRYLDLDQQEYTAMLRDMLEKHSNLHLDLSWIMFENYVLNAKGEVRPEWLALVADFQDRIFIGSDNIGHFATYHHNIVKYYALLDALEPAAAQKVALDNFLRLLPGAQLQAVPKDKAA